MIDDDMLQIKHAVMRSYGTSLQRWRLRPTINA